MKKYLAITAALALVLTACGHAAPDSTPTLTAATETMHTYYTVPRVHWYDLAAAALMVGGVVLGMLFLKY